MILKQQEIIDIKVHKGEFESKAMSLSNEDMAWIMSMLSDLYKDPYSIIPQEWLSNSWDSHLENGTPDLPIVLQIKKDSADKWFVAAQDYGVGLSPERIKIFGAFGKSTKRTSESALGAFGIGSKSVLSYTKQFFIDTVWNGTFYKYMIAPNSEGIPSITLLHSEESDLENQSKLWFYLKPVQGWNKTTEAIKFVQGAKKKTLYFDNLVYDFDSELEDLNQYKRVEGKTFVYNPGQSLDYLHILIGQVPYEISWSTLGIAPINVPIAIKVEGVEPVPTREDIKYTSDSIQIIKDAIQATANELTHIINQNRKVAKDWRELLKLKREPLYVNLAEHTVYIKELIQYSKVTLDKIVFEPLKNNDISYLNASNIFPFVLKAVIKNGRKNEPNVSYYEDYPRRVDEKCMRLEGNFVSKKNTYINNVLDMSHVYVFKKKRYKLKEYKSLLNLQWSDKAQWRAKIQEYQKFVDEVWQEIPSYDNLELPKVYLERIKTKKANNKPTGSVTFYELERRQNYSSEWATTLSNKNTLEFNHKGLVIYGTKEDRVTLDNIWRIYANQGVKVYALAESNFKYLKESHQYVHMKDWHKTKSFSRSITAYKIYTVLDKYKKFIEGHNDNYYQGKKAIWVCKDISSEFATLLKELYDYSHKHYAQNRYSSYTSPNIAFMDSCIETAETEKLWDYGIYHKIGKLEKYLEKFSETQVFKEDVTAIQQWKPMYIGYIKKVSKDIRMDLKWYQHKTFENA